MHTEQQWLQQTISPARVILAVMGAIVTVFKLKLISILKNRFMLKFDV